MTRATLCAGAWGASLAVTVLAAKGPDASAHSSPWLLQFQHSTRQPRSGQAVQVTAVVQPGVTALTLRYQVVRPGAYVELKSPAYGTNWSNLPLTQTAVSSTSVTFHVEMPSQLNQHRSLIRYRLSALDSAGRQVTAPGTPNRPLNEAYFVYDGVPAWRGAIRPRGNDPRQAEATTFSADAMNRVQVCHFLARKTAVENTTWREHSFIKEYKYTGTLVVDGTVYDHVGFRARGGVWRYALGKNMWKFDFPPNHGLKARDDFGRPYPAPWAKLNLRSCIQQGDYGCRGEQGMFESVGFRLFNLAGVPAPRTFWLQLRIIDEAEEQPADQYAGDFWGLYLAIENEDGRFLKAHRLPKGNLYKMANGTGELEYRVPGGAADGADLVRFMSAYAGNPPEAWWRANVNLPAYYSYRAICECIHHYDIGDGKNYDYYHDPATDQWLVIPWDIDLTWADHMYGNGEEPFKHRVLARPLFRLEYQNRLREIRDLLFNPDQTGQLIDEHAAVIWDPTGAPSLAEADRRKWDYHPMMGLSQKAGQGRFFQATASRDFPGMLQLMKNYVKARGTWIDQALLPDPALPATPTVRSTGPAQFPPGQLHFRAAPYQGAAPFAAVKWRVAQVGPATPSGTSRPSPRHYEITPVWESAESNDPTAEITVPDGPVKTGNTYRVRARMKDVTGRWSHWSAPVEFTAGQ